MKNAAEETDRVGDGVVGVAIRQGRIKSDCVNAWGCTMRPKFSPFLK